MEERGLRVAKTDKAFFSKISTTISKLLIPTKIGINGMLITLKRNNVLKNYETVTNNKEEEKEEMLQKKYEDAFILYLESIDKYVMDSIYKKVRAKTATTFEEEALSRYYAVIHLKETQYLEYKYRKQKYLLELDYDAVKNLNKAKITEKYKKFYISKIDSLYKGLLKHFSIKLADNLSSQDKNRTYEKIFDLLEEYITNILPIKLEIENNDTYKEVIQEYNKFENYTVGKLDQNELIEKRMVLISLSRKLFTHSIPLIVAEQCYIKLLKDIRSLIVDTKIAKKREKAYTLLIKLIEEYNVKLLSTKIYWDKPEKRIEYKEFWNKYKELANIKDKKQAQEEKEILFIKSDLKQVYTNENKYYKIIQFYKNRLVSLGAMKQLKNKCISEGTYIGRKITCKN